MNADSRSVNGFAAPANETGGSWGIRSAAKAILRLLFGLPALWQLVRYRLARAAIGEDRAFLGLTERLARCPGYWGVYLRAATYGLVLRSCAQDVQIGFGTVFSRPVAVLREHVYVGRYCSLGWVEIERDVMLADFVAIPSGRHTHQVAGDTRTPPRLGENRYQPVRVGEGSWVGTGAVVLAEVGRYCVIGAGAVVTKPIPDFSVAVGTPARVVASTANRPEAGSAVSQAGRGAP
jgi:acetyltransferase-like isoleucine patch superfamily enzyme